jgi:hypothetical protein
VLPQGRESGGPESRADEGKFFLTACGVFLIKRPHGDRAFKIASLVLSACLAAVILFPWTASLVTGSAAFYNPSITASETVVSFIRYHGTQPTSRTVASFASECVMNIDLHFGNSQEH